MFTRSGEAVQVAEGATSFTRARKCGRCGGAGGSDKWAHTGWTCFDCGGEKFRGTETIKVYTAEKLAKLNATAEKAAAKRAAKAQAAAEKRAAEIAAREIAWKAENAALIARAAPFMMTPEGQEPGFIARVMEKAIRECFITENQAAAVLKSIETIEEQARIRQASRHIGKIGQRIEAAVTVERVASFPRPKFGAPWIEETFNIVTMRTAEGAAIISKSASFWAEKGEEFTVKGTVKEHGEYKGEAQTIIQRVTITGARAWESKNV
jgi:hypothetical protein